VGKIAGKAVCRSVFLTIWQCILSAELTKKTVLLAISPTGKVWSTPTDSQFWNFSSNRSSDVCL